MAINFKGITSHTGLVLSLRQTSLDCGYDAAFYAIVWNPTSQKPESVGYGDTISGHGSAEVDATPEVLAAYRAHQDALQAVRDAEAAAIEAAIPSRGRNVEVFRGRKVPVGTTGRVFWYGDTAYGARVGIETLEGVKHFTAASNVRVIQSPAEIRAGAVSHG